jgi:peptidoglycan/LPS O-acetylase OafA/YrhL
LNSTGEIISAAFAMILALSLMQAWYPNLFHYWHFSGTWSVSVEMFLYACLPVVRTLSRYRSRVLFFLAAALILFSATLLPSNQLTISRGIEFAVFYAIPAYHLPEFIIGYILFQLYI